MLAPAFKRLLHWGPLCVLGIIKLITWCMVHHMGMYWPPFGSRGGTIHAAIFFALDLSTLYYFLQSVFEGPGFVPLGWKPEKQEDTQYLQYCTICKGYKAPRSHHCSQCGRCVMKMDHHCPWVNCCVGHSNHCFFTLFLFFAVLGCLHASIVLTMCIYHAINRVWYIQFGSGDEPLIYLTLTTLLATLLAIGMAVGVVVAVGALFYLQVRAILRNSTTIEDWILEKAAARRSAVGLPPLRAPYDVGWRGNAALLWRGGGGLHWPLAPGAHQYDLTREQLAQKADKLVRSRLYRCISAYSGRRWPLAAARAALHAPCTGEARVPLAPGDRIRVTRHRQYWLFGEKLLPGQGDTRGPRGWFPRGCVEPADAEYRDAGYKDAGYKDAGLKAAGHGDAPDVQ